MTVSDFFYNPNARIYEYDAATHVLPKKFHSQLPNFRQTPLIHLPKLLLGLDHVYVKDESQRLGLPSFKILGASWGTFRSIAQTYGLALDSNLETVRCVAQQHGIHLITATDGNHGRAIAHMAKLLGIEATIFVPDTVNKYTRGTIEGEGARVFVVYSNYDASVIKAYDYAREAPNRLYIQDTSFESYHEIPAWIVQGYTTMFEEVEAQLGRIGLKATHILTPVGVGSLAHAVVAHCKSASRAISVIAVESEVAACLQISLQTGTNTPISTETTIMDGINCGTVSDISWPILKDSIDGAITISDHESHETVQKLATIGINAGPCGASTTAALRKLLTMPTSCSALGLDQNSVIVLLNTEGPREYAVPK